MKKDYTHICIVLDASGSMECIAKDIRGSFNSFLNQQRALEGKTVFDLFQFSDEVERIVRSTDLSLFQDDLMAQYTCNGCTALNDAVCIAIDTIGKEFAAMPEEERPENVLCVIITDGEENASTRYSAADTRKRIEHQQEVYSWNFLFLAANQDAFTAGEALGVRENARVPFVQTPDGVCRMARAMACEAIRVRKRKGEVRNKS